jgi:hypothetical protein
MTKIHGDRQDFTGPSGRGWRRCICTVETTEGKASESPSHRVAARKKGDQCSAHVSPDRIKKMGGLPICKAHEDQWERHLSEDEERRKALRRKYDPGPLYPEGT